MAKIEYSHNSRGDICLPKGPPFDGKPVLIKLAAGWVEAYWADQEIYYTLDGKDYSGFCWSCLDDQFEIELDEALAWLPLPEAK